MGTAGYDAVNKAIVEKLGLIHPTIPVSSYDIDFHDLLDSEGNPIPNRPIVEVKVVKPIFPRRDVRYTNKRRAFIKTAAGKQEAIGERLVALANEIEKELKEWQVEEQKKREKKPQRPTFFENPYNTAAIATEDMFKGRKTEIEHLRSAITNGTHTAIFGLQRMGKTSLVKETLRHVSENCIFVEVDLQRYGGEGITYKALLHAIVTGIAAEISRARLQEVVNEINILAGLHGQGDKHGMLDDFSRVLKEILKRTRRKVVLFLDEFSELCQTVDRNAVLLRNNPNREARIRPQEMLVDVSLMHWFSSLMRDPELARRFVLIFAVRPFVAEYDTVTNLQILKLVTPITLHYLRKPAAKALMVEPLRSKIEHEAGSIDYLYNLTAGHPYLIQFFLHEIINRIQQDGRSRIEKQDITRFEEEVVSVEEVYDGQFAVLDSDYSVESVRSSEAARKGKGVLAVIARIGGEQEDDGWVPVGKVHELLTRHRMPEDEIYDILAKLRRARIIEEREADREKLQYRISIPLLRKRYIRQNMYQRHFLQRGSRP